MTQIDPPPFKDLLLEAFKEWETTQPKKRSSITAFARWLSDNSDNTEIKQQIVDTWMNGTIPKDYKYIIALVEKLGDWVYESLGLRKPNSHLVTVNKRWEFISPERQKEIADKMEEYEAENQISRVHETSKRPKARKS